MAAQTDDQRAGRGVWLGIVLGLGFVVAANAVMITIAVKNPPAKETHDHYGDAMKYDEVIAARAASESLGWKVWVEPCHSDGGPCPIEVTVKGADGAPVDGLTGSLLLRRHDSEAYDRTGELKSVGEGRYATEVDLGAGGLYEVAISLARGDEQYSEKRRVVVRAD